MNAPLIDEIPCDLETPVSLFSRWKDEEYAFLLESVEGGERWGRFSFIGLYPSLIFRFHRGKVEIVEGKKRRSFTSADPLGELRKILGPIRDSASSRLAGGLVGAVSYDAVRYFETIPERAREDVALPDFCFMLPQVVLSLDNLKQTLQVRTESVPGAGKLHDQVVKRLKKKGNESSPKPVKIKWESSLSQKEFEQRVGRIKEYILAGDVTQTVLSLRFVTACRQDPFQVYRRLRQINPSPYLFYLKMGEMQLVGASPETMVRLENGEAILRPIAGTRQRGADETEDHRLERALLADPKEKAEHIMLVDLGRNDLGRVAEPGSVKVDQLMKVERYSHVMHIVSNIRAKLQKGSDAFDLLRAAFPAGTLTGSPKVRAMEIIEELEPVRRGFYGGSVGYFSTNGNMDMAITIRSALFHRGKVIVQAGAGIVADSDPGREYQECVNKAKGMREAIEGK